MRAAHGRWSTLGWLSILACMAWNVAFYSTCLFKGKPAFEIPIIMVRDVEVSPLYGLVLSGIAFFGLAFRSVIGWLTAQAYVFLSILPLLLLFLGALGSPRVPMRPFSLSLIFVNVAMTTLLYACGSLFFPERNITGAPPSDGRDYGT